MTGAAGKAADKPVGVCGEAARDPLLALVLVGLGITSLSMAPNGVPAVRFALSRTTMAECEKMAAAARARQSTPPPPGPRSRPWSTPRYCWLCRRPRGRAAPCRQFVAGRLDRKSTANLNKAGVSGAGFERRRARHRVRSREAYRITCTL